MSINKYRLLGLCICSALGVLHLSAQEQNKYGRVTGSVESNMGFYLDDPKLKNQENHGVFGTNSFVNLGYEYKRLRFGMQYDIYEPVMVGYSRSWDGNKVLQGFAAYEDDIWSITAGSFYEQLGSGLLFRTYEDRTLGLNTAMLGGALRVRPLSWLSLKAFAGIPRKYMRYVRTAVYGADLDWNVTDLVAPESDWLFTLGGSWVLRDDRTKKDYEKLAPSAVHGYSGRMQLAKGPVTLGAEYTEKTKNAQVYDPSGRKGRALLLNGNLDFSGIGVAMEYRSIKNMGFGMEDINIKDEPVNLNYIPSLTKQHKYSLMLLKPHKVADEGETGGQIDVFGEIPFSSDRYPLKYSLNASYYKELTPMENGEDNYLMKMQGDLSFAEAGMELEKKWNKNLKTIIAFDWQRYSEFSDLMGDKLVDSEILVADILYKLNRKNSLRMELQHAWSTSANDQRWIMGLLEWGFAPSFMLYVSDMYNYQSNNDRIHYYNVGASYVWNNLRVAASYGRNRAGEQCSGGVCRYVPEHSGFMVNVSFNY